MDRSSYPFEIAIALLVLLGLVFIGPRVATLPPVPPATHPAATQSAAGHNPDEAIAIVGRGIPPSSGSLLLYPLKPAPGSDR